MKKVLNLRLMYKNAVIQSKAKSFMSVFVFLFTSLSCFGQHWGKLDNGFAGTNSYYEIRSLFADSVSGKLYVGGNFTIMGGKKIYGIASWDGENWDSLGSGSLYNDRNYPFCDQTEDIIRYKEYIYAGGIFGIMGGLRANAIARWDGNKWDTVGHGVTQNYSTSDKEGLILKFNIINDTLVAFGEFFKADTNILVNNVAKWDGKNWSKWHDFKSSNFDDTDPGFYRKAIEYKNEIYLPSGKLKDSTGQDVGIVRWNGKKWNYVGYPIRGGYIHCLAVYKDELYVAGSMNKNGGEPGNSIAKWDGTKWSEVGGGITLKGKAEALVKDMIVYKNELYVVGYFTEAGGIPAKCFAKWDGTKWCGFNSSIDGLLHRICNYKDTLIVAGGFNTINGDTFGGIAKWIGGNYIDTCGVINSGVSELKNTDRNIFVYPNPATTELKINVGAYHDTPVSYKIFDIMGKVVGTQNFVSNDNIIDISKLTKGIYIIELTTKEGIVRSKFVKE